MYRVSQLTDLVCSMITQTKNMAEHYTYLFAMKHTQYWQYKGHSTKQAGQQGSIQTALIIAIQNEFPKYFYRFYD